MVCANARLARFYFILFAKPMDGCHFALSDENDYNRRNSAIRSIVLCETMTACERGSEQNIVRVTG